MPTRRAKATRNAVSDQNASRASPVCERRGWSVVTGSGRRNTSRPQRRPNPREAVDRSHAVRLAQRVLAVPRFLEQRRQRAGGVRRHAESGDREPLEFPRREGDLLRDAPGSKEAAEPIEAREDRLPHVATEFELRDRGLHRGGRLLSFVRSVGFIVLSLERARLTSEEVGESDDRDEDADGQEESQGRADGGGPRGEV